MRILLIVLAVVVGLIGAAFAAVFALFDQDLVVEEISRQAAALTGRDVAIEGPVNLSVVPRPRVSLGGVTLANAEGAAAPYFLKLDRLDLQVSLLPLLSGRLEVAEARLVRPELHLEVGPGGETNLPEADVTAGGWPLREVRLERISILDGSIAMTGSDALGPTQLDAVNLDLAAESASGPFTLTGGSLAGEEPLRLTAEIGELVPDGMSSVRMSLAVGGTGEEARLDYSGFVEVGDPVGLRGELKLEADKGEAMTQALHTLLGANAPEALPLPDLPLRAHAEAELANAVLSLDDLRVTVGDDEARGRLTVELGPGPAFDLELDARRLTLPGVPPADLLAFDWLPAVSHGVQGSVSLRAAALHHPEGQGRRLNLLASLPGNGDLVLDKATVILPGEVDVAVAGRISGLDTTPVWTGRATAVGDDLRAFLDWLGVDTGWAPAGRLRTFSLAGDVEAETGRLRLSGGELNVDASAVQGSLALVAGDRMQLALRALVNRINLDAYLPEEVPEAAIDDLKQRLLGFDAAVDVEVSRVSWRGARFDPLIVRADLEQGRLSVDQLSIGEAADARAHLVGVLDLARDEVDIAFDLTTAQPVRLVQPLGIELPPALTRLAPLSLHGTTRGGVGAADVEVELRGGDLRVGIQGQAGGSVTDPTLNLEIAAAAPDLAELLRRVAVVGPETTRFAGPLLLDGQLVTLPGEPIVGRFTSTLGPMQLDGALAWDRAGPRPRLSGQLDARPLDLVVLAALPAGVRAFLPGLAAPRPASGAGWSREPFELSWLDAADAELDVAASGVNTGRGAFGPLEGTLRLESGRVSTEIKTAGARGGLFLVRGSLEATDAVPAFDLDATLDDIDPGQALGLLGIAPIVSGSLDLHAELQANGASPQDLVAALEGDIDWRIRDGDVKGLDLALLTRLVSTQPRFSNADLQGLLGRDSTAMPLLGGPMRVRGGVIEGEELGLVLDQGEARIQARLDLPRWQADIDVVLMPAATDTPAPLALRISGSPPRLGLSLVRTAQP